MSTVFTHPVHLVPYSAFRRHDDFGLVEYDLAAPPLRFFGGVEPVPPAVEIARDARRLEPLPLPSTLLNSEKLPADDNWQAQTRRTLARLWAWFLVCEDPQRRLESREIQTLAHQASLVRHILDSPALMRVLIADEVGLGKTVEAGLIISELLDQQPGLRVLYLAPARLVNNVHTEFKRLGLHFRRWKAGDESDANISDDPQIIGSIHKAAHPGNFETMVDGRAWDILVVDECHHLSSYGADGGKPVRQYALVQKLIERSRDRCRVILMSGTPHQGNPERFENLLRLLKSKSDSDKAIAGRVIYRTKEDVRGWHDEPLFPLRQVNAPRPIPLSTAYKAWLEDIHEFYVPSRYGEHRRESARRAAGWRCAQALQWAASSVQAGLGYLVRQAIRLGWNLDTGELRQALAAIRPYRLGPLNEDLSVLFERISREIDRQGDDDDIEDIEEFENESRSSPADPMLSKLLADGVRLLSETADSKWDYLWNEILAPADDDQVVLFAQPIETVTALWNYVRRKTGEEPAIIVGGQKEYERDDQVQRFWDGHARFLISSRAGSEGINLQCAHRIVNVDVPWNPMDIEQRIGRVHRFGSEQTIIVDTIVLKNSREERAYAVARDKLAMIAKSLTTAPERFDELFSRVMSTVSPTDLQEVMTHAAVGPLSQDDMERIARLVETGFENWRHFHDRFHAERPLQTPDPGQASWSDVDQFLRQHVKGRPVGGFSALRFERRDNGRLEAVREEISVLELPNGQLVSCSDIGGRPITSPPGTTKKPVPAGLNLPAIASHLREAAFPDSPTGAGYLRWPETSGRPEGVPAGVNGLLVLVRLGVKTDPTSASWLQHDYNLHVWLVPREEEPLELTGESLGNMVRHTINATVRARIERDDALIGRIAELEKKLLDDYRRPDEGEREAGLRYAVFPLCAAIISDAA